MAELRCGRSLTIPNFHMGWAAEASRRWFARQRHALVFSREAAQPQGWQGGGWSRPQRMAEGPAIGIQRVNDR